MSEDLVCPNCGGPLVEIVTPDDTDENAEWVGYSCATCSPK